MNQDSRKQLMLKNDKLIKEHQSIMIAVETGLTLVNSALSQSKTNKKLNWSFILKTAETTLDYQVEANKLLKSINEMQLKLNDEQGLLSMGMSGGLIAKKLRSKSIKKAISDGEKFGQDLVDELKNKIKVIKQNNV